MNQWVKLLFFWACCSNLDRELALKGMVMQIEKASMNGSLHASKGSLKFRVPAIYNFSVIYPWNFLFP